MRDNQRNFSVSVLFSIIGFIVFGTKVNSLPYSVSLSYSFAFTVMGSILCTAACILSVVHWMGIYSCEEQKDDKKECIDKLQ